MCDEYTDSELAMLLEELAEEAMITGGGVWVFGPGGSEDQLFPPPARCSTVLPRR